MKRLLKIFGILILLVLAAAIVLPVIFKDEIIAKAKEEINKNLTAVVDFEDIDISLFRSFPDFSLTLKNTTVDGTETFEGIRLADIETFNVDLGLFSVISGNQYEIEGIQIRDARFHVIIDSTGKANYDITKPSETTDTTAETSSDFKLTLKSYQIENTHVIYDDNPGEMLVVIKDLDHRGKGDFTEEIVNLSTTTTIEDLSFKYGGIPYLSRVKTEADIDMEFNQPEFKITFGENSLSLNELLLKFEGFVALPDEDISMDLAFETPENDFKNLLSLIPAVYYEEFENVKTSGDFALAGMVRGVYNGETETYPSFDIKFDINDATFRYPDLPAGVEDINVDAHIYNKTSDLDGMVVEIPTAHAVVAGSPLDARMTLTTPISDPQIAAYIKTDFDLANVAKVVPASGYDYSGRIMADMDIAARMSDIDNERYENVKADGQLLVENVLLKSDSLPYDVSLQVVDMEFSPQNVMLHSFRSQIGRSDISANGKIDNLLGYMLQDKALVADFNMTSGLLDLNELSGPDDSGEAGEGEASAETSSMEAIRLPENINAILNATVEKVLYDNLEIENLSGSIGLKNGTASISNLKMDMLDGTMAMSGTYNSKPAFPEVDMKLDINSFSFKESFEKFVTVQKLAPIMENTTGTYGTDLDFKAKLNPDMSPDLTTVEAKGTLVAQNISTSPESLKRLADILRNPELSSLDLGRLNLSYEITAGRVFVEPFDIKAGNVTAVVSGSNGLDQTLDYTMDMKIPVSGIQANDLLTKIGATKGGKVDLAVKIGGTVSDPKISTSVGDMVGNVLENIKEQVTEKVEEVKKEAVDKVNTKAQELIDAAEKKGDQLIAEAQKQANAVKAEAKVQADKLRNEGDQAANKAMAEAKGNILKEAAAKKVAEGIRKEANDAATSVENEAASRAEKLVEAARAQKIKLVEEAREKAKLQNP